MYIALRFYFFTSSIIINRKAILNITVLYITVLFPRFQIIFNIEILVSIERINEEKWYGRILIKENRVILF